MDKSRYVKVAISIKALTFSLKPSAFNLFFLMLDIKNTDTGICFKIYVQPKASKNSIVGLHDDAIKIRLTAPPVDGAANKMCIKYLSKVTGIAKAAFEIAAGQTSRTKQIQIHCGNDNQFRDEAVQKIKRLITEKTP